MTTEVNGAREIRLHFEGATTSGHSIPARALIKSLDHLQRIIHLLAKLHRGDDPGRRGRASRDFEGAFSLTCKVPRAGSYVVPAEIGDSLHMNSFDRKSVGQVNRTFFDLTRAVGRGDSEWFRRIVPDQRYQALLVKEYRGIQPSKGLGLVCSIEDGEGQRILEGSTAQWTIEELDVAPGHERAGRVLCSRIGGVLVGMNFAKRRLRIRWRDGRVLDATYGDDFELALANHPRGLIQVLGTVTYDAQGAPVSLVDVQNVVQVNQDPIEVHECRIANVCYRIDPPLRFTVRFDLESCLYDLQGDLGICLFAEDRSGLEDSLGAEIQMLWSEYAREDPSCLSPEGLKLREHLRVRFREVGDGAQAPGR